MSRVLTVLAAVALCTVAACERSQVSTGPDKAGRYQGKVDAQPWDNEQFKGDRAAWEKAVKTRGMAQNEYRRAN